MERLRHPQRRLSVESLAPFASEALARSVKNNRHRIESSDRHQSGDAGLIYSRPDCMRAAYH